MYRETLFRGRETQFRATFSEKEAKMTHATVTMNPDGQITIPAPLRDQLHLQNGDALTVLLQDDHLVLRRPSGKIEAAFGMCKASGSASLSEMERAIKTRAQPDARR
jgi:AbrB family looped-hinge helix DNA binding protein